MAEKLKENSLKLSETDKVLHFEDLNKAEQCLLMFAANVSATLKTLHDTNFFLHDYIGKRVYGDTKGDELTEREEGVYASLRYISNMQDALLTTEKEILWHTYKSITELHKYGTDFYVQGDNFVLRVLIGLENRIFSVRKIY